MLMKKSLYFWGVMAMMALLPMQAAAQAYELRVLTFEDKDVKEEGTLDLYGYVPGASVWSDFIDFPQYGGQLLYMDGYGYSDQYYGWYDYNNTGIMSWLCDGYGSYCYWSGGHAISHYWSNDAEIFGDFEHQLTLFRPNADPYDYNQEDLNGNYEDGIAIEKGGHNGSDNFAVHFGYIDLAGYGLTYAPYIMLDEPRVIDHMYVNITTYLANCLWNGNDLTAMLADDEWIVITAYGYENGMDYFDDKDNAGYERPSANATSTFTICKGAGLTDDGEVYLIQDWTKWDLSELGKVELVEFSIWGPTDNGYGFSQPAYFAYDDVAVRFELDEADMPETFTRDGLTAGNYGTICLPRGAQVSACTGAEFYKPVAKTSDELILEEVSELVAGEGYIFKATDSKLTVTYSTDYVSEPKAASTANAMQGVYIKTTIPAGKYYIASGQVKESTGLQYAGANRAYIDLSMVPGQAPAQVGRRVSMAIEETTGWNSVKDDTKVTKVLKNGVIYIQHNGHTYDVMGNLVK